VSAQPTPKDRFSALDMLALARELRTVLHARADKAFDLPGGGWSVTLRSASTGRRELILVPARYGALVEERAEHAEELTPLAKELRRLLSGAILHSVSEPRGERYVEIGFRRADGEELGLILEIFGPGNLLVTRAGRIVAVARPRTWAHRTMRVGAEYARPAERTDPWSADRGVLEAELSRSRTDLSSTLAARLALGGPIAEEILARSGVPDGPASVDAARTSPLLHRSIAELYAELGEPPRGFLYERDGIPVDATPYHGVRWSADPEVREVPTSTFSEAAYRYFRTLATAAPVEVPAVDKAREDLERQAGRQRSAIASLEVAAKELNAQAQAIFSHYPEAESALARVRAEGSDERRIEVLLGERTVPLLLDRPLQESAQALYEESKRLQSKLLGARTALKETETRLASAPMQPTPSASSGLASAVRRKPRWFERYRWFLSSEGAIVIAGRDAASNDLIVRRHLREGDLYLHADLHGAASVIVKKPDPGRPAISEATVREAAQWAVAFSKAWRAGLASASAFWVHPDQVSKSPNTGEFVARGAWVIEGTKNYLKNLPLELGVGTIAYEDHELWTVAPPSSFAGRGGLRFLITPGEERNRPERESELARELGVARSLVQSLLPAGGITWRRP
jgi:predicted ribosome quality control (RQC) complex YloA/Tae2 family protein